MARLRLVLRQRIAGDKSIPLFTVQEPVNLQNRVYYTLLELEMVVQSILGRLDAGEQEVKRGMVDRFCRRLRGFVDGKMGARG